MKYVILLMILSSLTSLTLFTKIDNERFELLNNKYGTNYATGGMTTDNNGTVYFVSGNNNKNKYDQIFSFKDGEISKVQGIEDLKSISDTIYSEINTLYFAGGKLFIIAHPHLFMYENNSLKRLTDDLQKNYLREILDLEYKNNNLYFLVNDKEIESVINNIPTVIPHDKIAILDDNKVRYYLIDDSVTSNYQQTASAMTVKDETVWITFSSTPKSGGGLASFDGTEFKVHDLKYYNEIESIYRPSDIHFINDDLFVSFEANNIKDPTAEGFGGFVSFDFKEWNFFERSKLNENSYVDIRSFITVGDKNIWLATSTLTNINLQDDEITQYKMSEIFNLPGNSFNQITSLSYDNSTNTLWFNTVYSGIGYIENVTSSVENQPFESTIKCYPNPVVDELNITLSNLTNTSNVKINIYRMDGVLLDNIYDGSPTMNVSYNTKALNSGTYFIEIDTKYKKVTKKIIINK